jgi:hypothetical protein
MQNEIVRRPTAPQIARSTLDRGANTTIDELAHIDW